MSQTTTFAPHATSTHARSGQAAPTPIAPKSRVFRCINPRGYATLPFTVLIGLRYSPAIGIGAIILNALTLALMSQIGSEFTADGIVVRRFFSRTLLPWSSIQTFRTTVHRKAGTHIELVSMTGEVVRLSAPSSNTGGLQEGAARIVAELSRR